MRQFMRQAKRGAFRPIAFVIAVIAMIVFIIIIVATGVV